MECIENLCISEFKSEKLLENFDYNKAKVVYACCQQKISLIIVEMRWHD